MWILHEACLNFWPPKSCLVRPPIWNPHLSHPVPWLDSQFLEAIFKKNVLESASSSFCPLVLAVPLELVWQPSCSFRWQTMFSLVHVGTCCKDTPMLLTSFGGVLWNYLAVWFKIRQANPMAYTLCSFFFSGREKHADLRNTPRSPSKSLLPCEYINRSSSESCCPNAGAGRPPVSECSPACAVCSHFFCTFACLCMCLGMWRVKAQFVAIGSVLLPPMFWRLN